MRNSQTPSLRDRLRLKHSGGENAQQKTPLDCFALLAKTGNKMGGSGFLCNSLRQSPGFTLIEILVVIVIFGVSISFALLSFGDFGKSRQRKLAAETFIHYVTLVQQEAVLEASAFGLSIDSNGYHVMRFKPPKSWESLPRGAGLRTRRFPDGSVITLTVASKRQATLNRPGPRAPQLLVSPSGDLTPFILTIGSKENTQQFLIQGRENGTLSYVEKN